MRSLWGGGVKELTWLATDAPGLLATAGDGVKVYDLTVVPIVLGVILGGCCGALVGLILAKILRFIAYLFGKSFEGNILILIGGLAGAVALVWLAVTRGGF